MSLPPPPNRPSRPSAPLKITGIFSDGLIEATSSPSPRSSTTDVTPDLAQSIVLASLARKLQPGPGPKPAPPKRVKRIVVAVSNAAIWSMSPGAAV